MGWIWMAVAIVILALAITMGSYARVYRRRRAPA